MTPEQFAYWLQGFIEMNGGKEPTKAQWKSIKEHLATVFTKVTPGVQDAARDRLREELERRRHRAIPSGIYPGRIC